MATVKRHFATLVIETDYDFNYRVNENRLNLVMSMLQQNTPNIPGELRKLFPEISPFDCKELISAAQCIINYDLAIPA